MIEVLSPAGDFETLVFAINAGADAIYLGGNLFNARANATNFSDEEIIEAVKYAHLRDVKIYVTVNIIVFQKEVGAFIEYCDFLYKSNVDGLILQDVGLAYYLRQRYNDIEIHISTQVNTHNVETIKLFKELGFDRVVLARELDFEQIALLSSIEGIDTEVFVHGALCISHSGQCLMSYLNGGRSGNRGSCAQICRLPMKLYKNNEHYITKGRYLLSPKDVNNSEYIGKYIESGVSSLKIEGRMKSKEYVYKSVSNYRDLLDGKNVNNDVDLQKLYSRGFTNGYVNGYDASKLMNYKRPNHQGVEVGRVSFVGSMHLEVKLTDDIAQGDGLRIISQHDHHLKTVKLYKDDLLVNKGSKGDTIEFEFTNKGIRKGDIVVKTKDVLLEKAINSECSNTSKKLPIDINLVVHHNQNISAVTQIKDKVVITNFEYKPEVATNKPTSLDDIGKSIGKLGNTSFALRSIEINMNENLFVPLSILKKLKNTIVNDVSDSLLNIYCNRSISEFEFESNERSKQPDESVIYTDYKTTPNPEVESYNIKSNYKQLAENIVYNPKIYDVDNIYAEDYGTISLNRNNKMTTGHRMNITNIYGVKLLELLGANCITLSVESSYENTKGIIEKYSSMYGNIPNLAVFIYGYIDAMTLKYCPVNNVLGDGTKENCNLCRKDDYHIEIDGRRHKLRGDLNCNMHIYNSKLHDKRNMISTYKDIGVSNFVADLSNDDNEGSLVIDLNELCN